MEFKEFYSCAISHFSGSINRIRLEFKGAFPTGKSDPVILDESIKFTVDDKGKNPDVTAGQVLVHGAVYESLLVGCTAAFKTAVGAAIRFV